VIFLPDEVEMSTALERRMIKLEAAARPEENGITHRQANHSADSGELSERSSATEGCGPRQSDESEGRFHGTVRRPKPWPALTVGQVA
jgi:hypothetical protein